MKLQSVLEARYHNQQPYVKWTQEVLNSNHSYREAVNTIPSRDVKQAILDLTRYYGKPHKSNKDSDGKYYLHWQNEPGGEVSWDIVLWPSNRDIVVYKRNTVNAENARVLEARHHRQLHPIVLKIKKIIDGNQIVRPTYQAEEFTVIPGGEEKMVVNDLIKAFGQPRNGDVKWDLGPLKEVIPWKTWGVISPNGRVAYSIDIGYDDQPEYADAPYGVNFLSMILKKKKKVTEASRLNTNPFVAQLRKLVAEFQASDSHFEEQYFEFPPERAGEIITRLYGNYSGTISAPHGQHMVVWKPRGIDYNIIMDPSEDADGVWVTIEDASLR